MSQGAEVGLAAWRMAVGDEHVSTAPEALEACATATFPTSNKVVAILSPASAAEVGECVRIAGRCGVALYPVSRGRNWGLGSRVPPADGCAVLDLRRMGTITAFDDKMGTITLEPGVTFQQVSAYLKEAGARWFLPAIGGPPDASVIGNLTERGDGAGPTGDRAANACALDVVLPDGACITTGFGMFEGASMTTLSRAGVGPGLDGLFIQSGMGILVGATFFLSPIPAHLAVIRAKATGKPGLAATLDAARGLVRDGVVQPGCFAIWNATKVYMRGRTYPWAKADGRTPLPIHEHEAGHIWYMVASLRSASAPIGTALAAHAIEVLTASGAVVEIADDTSHPGLREEAAGALGGVDETTASSVYWRKTSPPPSPLAPEADGCGVHWLCIAVPLDGAVFAEAAAHIEAVALDYSFEAVISGAIASPRAIHLFVAIIYDREIAGEDDKAQACHDDMIAGLTARGIHPMRLGIQSMSHLALAREPYAKLMRTLRTAIDPRGVLAPGRYEL